MVLSALSSSRLVLLLLHPPLPRLPPLRNCPSTRRRRRTRWAIASPTRTTCARSSTPSPRMAMRSTTTRRRTTPTAIVTATGADGNDFALGRLFLCGIRYDDAAGALGLGVDALDDDDRRDKAQGKAR